MSLQETDKQTDKYETDKFKSNHSPGRKERTTSLQDSSISTFIAKTIKKQINIKNHQTNTRNHTKTKTHTQKK